MSEKIEEKETKKEDAYETSNLDAIKQRAVQVQQELSIRSAKLDGMERQIETETEAIARLRGGLAELLKLIELHQNSKKNPIQKFKEQAEKKK